MHPAAITRMITNGAILVVSPVCTAFFWFALFGCGVGGCCDLLSLGDGEVHLVCILGTCVFPFTSCVFLLVKHNCKSITSLAFVISSSCIWSLAPAIGVQDLPVIWNITCITFARIFVIHSCAYCLEGNLGLSGITVTADSLDLIVCRICNLRSTSCLYSDINCCDQIDPIRILDSVRGV